MLNVPVDLADEERMDPETRSWLAFAVQKLAEIKALANTLTRGRTRVADALAANNAALATRRQSSRVAKPTVKTATTAVTKDLGRRHSPLETRAAKQRPDFDYRSIRRPRSDPSPKHATFV